MDPLTRTRRICLSLPDAMEQEAWGHPTFRVRKRIFAMYHANHHGDGRVAVWCKAPPGVQGMLVRSAPEAFFVPPYVGVHGWVGVVLDRVDDGELEGQIVQSYCMVAPRRLQALVADR